MGKLRNPAFPTLFCKDCGHPSTDHTLTRLSEEPPEGYVPNDDLYGQWTLLDCRSWEQEKCACPAFMVHRRFHKRFPTDTDNE